ncbi:hypothetical protein ACSFCK_02135 [Brevibacterium luteolum]|uniref:hypothetical protein n=1 Tax=Brevibacterium luteolum TaxID=199591 RepID=UPI003EEEB7EE
MRPEACSSPRSRLLTSLAREHGRTVLVALHDLTAAAQFGDHVVLLAGGVQAVCSPEEVLNPARISAHFDVDAQWATVNGTRRLFIA